MRHALAGGPVRNISAWKAALVSELNPTLVDSLWPWRHRLNETAMVVSTLQPEDTVSAATEVARDVAQQDQAVMLTSLGATEPLFWHVPAGRELDTVRPDVVLMLMPRYFTPSTRLLLATAAQVVLITGSEPEDQFESLKVMQFIVENGSPSHIEVIVVANGRPAARETGTTLVRMASGRLGRRTSWRHLSTRRMRNATKNEEEGHMAATSVRSTPVSEMQQRTIDWEASFERAEKLLVEAQETLRRQLARTAEFMPPSSPDQHSDRPRAT